MPTIVFFQDSESGAWVMQNIGQGSAKQVLFAELDAGGMVKHYIRLNPVLKGEKVLFMADEFRHCIRLIADYTDVRGKHYYAVCEGSKTKNPRWHPLKKLRDHKWIPEANLSQHIKRLPDLTLPNVSRRRFGGENS